MESVKQELKIKVKLGVRDLYHFLLQYNYKSIGGIIGLLISGGALVYLAFSFGQHSSGARIALLFIGLLWTVVQPLLLFQKAAQQATRNPAYKEELEYAFGEKGMVIRQGAEHVEVAWENIVRVKEDKKQILLFTSRVHACILPKAQFEEQYEGLKELLDRHVSSPT